MIGFYCIRFIGRELVFLILLLGISLFYYTLYQSRSPLVYGIDGPYYLIQIDYIRSTGGMYYGDPPLTFYVLYLFYLVFGDSMAAVKIGSVFFSSLTVIPLFMLVRRRYGLEPAMVSTLLYIFSPHIIRLMGDFVKNTFGLLFLTIYLYFMMLWFREGRVSYLVFTVVALILTGLTHILAFGILMIYTLVYPLAMYISGRGKGLLKASIPLIVSIALFTIISYTLYPFYFSDFNRIQSYIGSILTKDLEYQVGRPRPSGPSLWNLLTYLITPLALLVASTPLVLHGLIRRKIDQLLFSSYIVLLILLNPLSSSGVFFRFTLSSIIPSALILAYMISRYKGYLEIASITLLILAPTITLSLQVATTWGPTITLDEYRELVEASKYVVTDKSSYARSIGITRYWLEYVVGPDRVVRKSVHPTGTLYIFISKDRVEPLPPPRPFEEIVFDGEHIQVRRITIRTLEDPRT